MEIVNKVAESGIVTIDLADHLPDEKELMVFDLKPFLFREMILREKEFRLQLTTHDWALYENKHVCITCSVDAIIPVWAFMLVASYLQPVAKSVFFGTKEERYKSLVREAVLSIDVNEYRDKRIVIKGCGETIIPDAAYVAITAHLRPVVKSLMYGEPCSTVPVYKKKA